MNFKRMVALLCALTVISIGVLLLISDFNDHTITNFDDLLQEKNKRVRLICAVENIQKGKNGWILQLSDLFGHEIRAFCEFSLIDAEALEIGSMVEIVADVGEDGNFVFIKSIEPYTSNLVNAQPSFYCCMTDQNLH
jgi:hypothetical protein